MGDSSEQKEYFSGLERRTLLILDEIIRGTPTSEQVSVIDDHLFTILKPKTYWGREGAEVKHIKAYEETCAIISQYVPKDPKRMSTREFFFVLNLLKEQNKKQAKAAKKRR